MFHTNNGNPYGHGGGEYLYLFNTIDGSFIGEIPYTGNALCYPLAIQASSHSQSGLRVAVPLWQTLNGRGFRMGARIQVVGPDGEDSSAATVVPEPSLFVMLLGPALLLLRRRR